MAKSAVPQDARVERVKFDMVGGWNELGVDGDRTVLDLPGCCGSCRNVGRVCVRGAGRLIRASVRHDLAVEKEVKYRLRNACLVGVVRDDSLPGLKWAVGRREAHNVAMQACSGGVAPTWWAVGAARMKPFSTTCVPWRYKIASILL